jgi:hypothetical protein
VDDGHEYLKPYSKEFKLNASEFRTNITIYCYRWQSPPQFLKEYGTVGRIFCQHELMLGARRGTGVYGL